MMLVHHSGKDNVCACHWDVNYAAEVLQAAFPLPHFPLSVVFWKNVSFEEIEQPTFLGYCAKGLNGWSITGPSWMELLGGGFKCLTKLFLICVHCGRFSILKPAVRNFSGSSGAKPSANPPSLIVDYKAVSRCPSQNNRIWPQFFSIYQFHVVISKVEPETPLFNRIFYLRVYEVVLIRCSCNDKIFAGSTV